MATPRRGIHETLLTDSLAAELSTLQEGIRKERLESADAADRLGFHIARIVQRAIEALPTKERTETGIRWARQILSALTSASGDSSLTDDYPHEAGEILRGIFERRPDGTDAQIPVPLIPLLDSTILTNSPGEPRIGTQILAEIHSADRIDLVMAFIRRSGIQPFLETLRRHTDQGRALRVLTTIYTGSTEARALDELRAIGAEIRVSYDETNTRLHAKSWLFHRDSGFSTAYIGSSNLTHSAQYTGLEWNVRLSGARNPHLVAKMAAVFDAYWNSDDFEFYDRETFCSRVGSRPANTDLILPPTYLRAEPFQERLLEQIRLARSQGHHCNLLVSATGTGKTVMAALDYLGLRGSLRRSRLLFVAHREEILEQSRRTFQHALRRPDFGELWVGGHRPNQFEHVFASIQSLAASGLSHLDPRHFDVVIVDEFHHAAASTYKKLLEHVAPVELLGLTATPERADGLTVMDWFGGRIAAELRLWDAIDQHRLVPFTYYGLHDFTDLTSVPWRKGQGYDVDSLSQIYTGNDVRAQFILKEIERKVGDSSCMRALAFCVSVNHARFMARIFTEAGLPAAAICGDTPEHQRKQAIEDLKERKLRVICAVDLFNEGVDIPSLDTLLLLRPTDSPVLFIQQLGRGLRRHDGKTNCTILDFIGHHHRNFRFDRRFRALLGVSRQDLEKQLTQGFPFLPAGCHMELDRVAADIVLQNIKDAIPTGWNDRIRALRDCASGSEPPRLKAFLESRGLELEDIYRGDRSWSDHLQAAGFEIHPPGPDELELRRALGRLLHVDDPERVGLLAEVAKLPSPPDLGTLSIEKRRRLRMLVASLMPKRTGSTQRLSDGCALLWSHPQILNELGQLAEVLAGRINHLTTSLDDPGGLPLRIHAQYTRIEILAGCDVGAGAIVPPWREGVRYERDLNLDILVFTLDKTDGGFSPTTRYRDYALNRDLIHWESQNSISSTSETGCRYIRRVPGNGHVFLFARHHSNNRAFYFLGPATYVSHTGEKPLAITWKLKVPLPGDLFNSFAAAVA